MATSISCHPDIHLKRQLMDKEIVSSISRHHEINEFIFRKSPDVAQRIYIGAVFPDAKM